MKSTQAEIDQRVNAIYHLLLRRESRATICGFAREKWGVSDDQTDRYIARARALMAEEAAADRATARSEHLAIRKDLFNKLYREEKWACAFQVVQDEAKMLGLYFCLEDHVKAAIAGGYQVMRPEEAVPDESAEDFEVEIGLAEPEEADAR